MKKSLIFSVLPSLAVICAATAAKADGPAPQATVTVLYPAEVVYGGTWTPTAPPPKACTGGAPVGVEDFQAPPNLLPNGQLPSQGPSSGPSLTPNLGLAAAAATAAASPDVPAGWIGIHSADQLNVNGFNLEPPDQGLAVNNNVVAEINNLVLEFFQAPTGTPLAGPVSLDFMKYKSCNRLFGPQAFFDPTTGRWFLTVMEYPAFGSKHLKTWLDLAVSETSDALGEYYLYHVEAYSADLEGCNARAGTFDDCLPDYPKAGYDANGFYISVNLWNWSLSGNFVEAATYVLPKSTLIEGPKVAKTDGPESAVTEKGKFHLRVARVDYAEDFVVQPSVPAPGTAYESGFEGTEYLMEALGPPGVNYGAIRVYAISGTDNLPKHPELLTVSGWDVALANPYSWTVAQTEPGPVGTYCGGLGYDVPPLIGAGYGDFGATIQMTRNVDDTILLTGALNFQSPDGNGLPRDVIAWYTLVPSLTFAGVRAAVSTSGYLVPPNGFSVSFPAIGLDENGNGLMGYNVMAIGATPLYPSAAILPFSANGPLSYSINVTGPGIGADDGYSGCPAGGAATEPHVGYWGFYGAATVDAATGHYYTANENISGARATESNWGTFISQQ